MIGRLTSLPMTFVGALVLGLCQELTERLVALARRRRVPPGAPGHPRPLPRAGRAPRAVVPPVGRSGGRARPAAGARRLRRSLVAGAVFVGVVALVGQPRRRPTSGRTSCAASVIGHHRPVARGRHRPVGPDLAHAVPVPRDRRVRRRRGVRRQQRARHARSAGWWPRLLGVLVALPSVRLRGLHLALSTFGIALDRPRGDPGRPAHLRAVRPASWPGPTSSASPPARTPRSPCGARSCSSCWRSWWAWCGGAGSVASSPPSATASWPPPPSACGSAGPRSRSSPFSAFIAGCAGALFGGMNGTADGTQFDPVNSLVIVLFAFVGGITTVTGAAIAGGAVRGPRLRAVHLPRPRRPGVRRRSAAAAIGLGRQPDGLAGVLTSGFGQGGRWRAGARRPRRRRPAAPPAAELGRSRP